MKLWMIRKSAIALVTVLALLLSGCSSTPVPSGMFEDAEAAIRRAEEMGAVEHAPLELRFAREKLAGAKLSLEERNNERVTRLLKEVEINCELAIAKTAAARARDAARKQEESNRQLKVELGMGDNR